MKDLIKAHSISRFRSLKDLLFWLSGVRPSLPEPIIKLMCHSEHEFLLSEQFSCNLCLSLQGLVFPFSGGSKIERFLWYAEPATLKCQYDTAILKTEMPWDLGTVLGNPGNELGTEARLGNTAAKRLRMRQIEHFRSLFQSHFPVKVSRALHSVCSLWFSCSALCCSCF